MHKNYAEPSFIKLKTFTSSQFLLLAFIPILSILATLIMNFYNINLLSMTVIPLVALLPVLVAFDKIDEKYYPLAVFVTAFSLICSVALVTTNIWGYDIQSEYGTINGVIQNSFWNYNFFTNDNGMLSISILGPVLYYMSNLDTKWIVKLVYPLLLTLLPLGLFHLYKSQTNSKIAFLACFFFISFSVYYTELLQLLKQQIAELFLVLLFIVLINEKSNIAKSFLIVFFGLSIIVSHYGISYIFILFLLMYPLIMLILTNSGINNLRSRLLNSRIIRFIFSIPKNYKDYPQYKFSEKSLKSIFSKNLTFNFILLFITAAIAWYIYVSSSNIINSILGVTGGMF